MRIDTNFVRQARRAAAFACVLVAAFPAGASAQLPNVDVGGTVGGVVDNTVNALPAPVRQPVRQIVPARQAPPSNPPSTPGSPSGGPSSPGGSSQGSDGGNDGSTGSVQGSERSTPATRRAARARATARRARRVVARTRARQRAAVRQRQARDRAGQGSPGPQPEQGFPVARTVRRIVEVIPAPIKALIGVLALLALVFAGGSLRQTARARSLRRQRETLLQEVGLLQKALLPEVPAKLDGVSATVAYQPADGPAAGGDFYDVFRIGSTKTAILVGDVSGHGRDALARTTLVRYSLRAYLEAGVEPRGALAIAGRTLNGGSDFDFATVVVAVYDHGPGTLTYASAGHPPPILIGSAQHEPVTACSSPPLGIGLPTGLRQTTVSLPAGSVACFYTDGLTEARSAGELLGTKRVAGIVKRLGSEGAEALLARVREQADLVTDDMAACVIRTGKRSAPTNLRVEELELSTEDAAGDSLGRFLRACGRPVGEIPELVRSARSTARKAGGAVVRVRLGDWRPGVDVLPANVASLEAASIAGTSARSRR